MYKLREIRKDDISTINNWRNDPDLIACLGAPYRYINEDVDNNWFDQYMRSRNNAVRCAIVDENKADCILGMISLLDINYISRSGQLHIMIGEANNRGKGMGAFAVNEMLTHAFNNLNLHRIELNVLERNSIAQKLYKKCGFAVEGLRREANYKNGQYENVVMMSILKSEWKNQH